MKFVFPLLSLGNEAPVVRDSADLKPGLIALANESRFVSTNYSEPLTQFTVGYRDPENLLAAVDYVAPPVPAPRRFEWKKADNSKAFLTEVDDERAIGGGFKRVEYAGSTQLGKTTNRGLTYTLDTDEDGGVTTEESIVAMLQQRIIRNKYRRAMTALAALSAGANVVFSAATQPDELLKAKLDEANLESGIYPNRGLFGLGAWRLRSAAYSAQDNAGAKAALMRTQADLATELMLGDIRVDKAVYQSAANAKARIVGSSFFGFVAFDGLSKDDPSHLKQFYTPVGGGRFRVYRKVTGPADKFVEITVEHYESITGTSTIGVARGNAVAA